MRFRLKPVVLTLLCTFAHHADAAEAVIALRMDKTFRALPEPTQDTPSFVEADHLQGKKDNQIEATGNAILRKRGQFIRADRLLYFQDTRDVDAQGSVVLEQGGNTMSGPHLQLNLDTSIGTMEQPVFYFAENDGRGSADVMHIQDKQHYTLDNAIYTTCPADDEDWQLKMRGLDIDRDRQIGVAHHAWVEFMGVPILYSPWMDFPLNDRRKSGFLTPLLGGTTKGGSELTIPYYWNIAPNRDATFSPRAMTKRGLLLNNEFRYLEDGYGGEVNVDVLPGDALAQKDRGRFALKHNQMLASRLTGYINFSRVSDNAYFRDLGDAVNITSTANLLQEGGLIYGDGWWSAAARVQRYQTLQDPAAPIGVPYARLPQLTLNAQQQYAGANVAFAGEYVDFSHPTALNGQRLVFIPSVSYPLVSNPAFYVTPKVSLHNTQYVMGTHNAAALPDSSRTLPMFSVDSGVAFERDWNLFGGDYLQTLEPRAFYVYVPYKNQDKLPVFDSAQADFSFVQMFAENRFFGNDRVGDANHVTLAVTSRLLDQADGTERLKLTLGERFSLKTPQVNLVAPTTTTNKSDILLAASGRATRTWTFDSELQYSPSQARIQHYNATARYRSEAGKVLNLGYRYIGETLGALIPGAVTATGITTVNGIVYPTTNGVPYTTIGGKNYTVASAGLSQMDISGQWPLSNRWHAVGRLNYSFLDRKTLESIVGLEYNQSCWMLRLVAQRFTVAQQQANTGLFLQLELNDFVAVGSDPLVLLRKSVAGYSKLNEKPANKSSSVLR
ncbi:MAG TPA: LPS-assembly protein LptD [Gallionella sp.]|nr:LPS-assembly protein LptD [Gallionella sp.]